MTIQPSRLLRIALAIDAAGSAPIGLLQTAAAVATARLTGLSASLLLGTGLFMLIYAAALVVMARSASLPQGLVRVVVAGNFAWAVACVAAAGLLAGLTLVGVGYLLFQAAAVTAFAILQRRGLAQSMPAAAMA